MANTRDRLGMTYSSGKTSFRVWAPTRDRIDLLIYQGAQEVHRSEYQMTKDEKGMHSVTINGDLKGLYYTFLINKKYEVMDPYSIATSVNSTKSAIVDLKDTNPVGWDTHKIPSDGKLCEGVIYELHMKDFSFDQRAGIHHRGKYLGLCERGTNYKGLSTGIDHLKELGITHVQLMPIFDFLTVNEEEKEFYKDTNYNWGYDPELYNVPEGSYSTNPRDPISRIIELKKVIMALHKAGIKVIMDVVYNHTYRNEDSNFNILYPSYYRRRENGTLSDGSGCGNELATEKPMVKKFIKDSLEYWVKEYKIDGFRFDLMALIDIDTLEEIIQDLRGMKEDIIIYGEPWMAGNTVLPTDKTTTKGTQKGKGFALFNDDFRNAIKGDNNGYHKGFSQGNINAMLATETGIVGSIAYDNEHVGFASKADESINYINAHDNLILYDKIRKVFPSLSEEEIIQYNKFAMGILFTSQGIPFIHAGNEFLRSKNMHCNSYNAPISINAIDWTLKEKNLAFYQYTQDLIRLRKNYEEFRMNEPESIRNRIKFLFMREQENLISYIIQSKELKKYLLIIHNGNPYDYKICFSKIKSCINEKYLDPIEELCLKQVLNRNGLVKSPEKVRETDNITIPGITTAVYEIFEESIYNSME